MSRTTTHIRRLALAALVAVAAFVGTSVEARAETVTIPVPKATVLAAVNAALAGTQARLHAYGPKHTSGRYLSWHQADAGSVSVPGVPARTFNLPEIQFKPTKTRLLRFYVNDLRTSSLSAAQAGARIRLTAQFESADDEIKVRCLRYRVLKDDWKAECAVNSLLVGSAIQIDDAKLDIEATPVARAGSISYDLNGVSFTAKYKAGGICSAKVFGIDDFCRKRISKEITPQVEANVTALLGSKQLRDLVASRVRTTLEAQGILKPDWKITAVTDAGANYNLTIERPDQIGPQSVQIVSFTPLTAHVQATCPVNVGFRAKVWTQYKLTGRAWLQHENGKTSPKLQWTAGKNATTTSTIARAFEGTAGTTYAGRWSRLVVEWKDQKGTVYTATSPKAAFKVTCLKSGIGFGG